MQGKESMLKNALPFIAGLLLTVGCQPDVESPPQENQVQLAEPVPKYQPFTGRTSAEALFTGYERRAFYAPMSDGVQLAITVYLPSGGPDIDQFPLLLWYLPGHRESINIETGEISSAYAEEDLQFFTSHGYALAAAEMRGSGASFGTRELDRGPQIGKDGKQLIDWIAEQPWSNGKVGMVGLSYQGFSQYATASQQPAALKAIFPEIAGFDDYTSMFYPGGIFTVALSELAAGSIVRDDQNHFDQSGRRPRLPSVPVIDEDGDGELADEIPLDKNGDGNFLNDGPPTYADGEKRKHVYYRATQAHLANTNLTVDALSAAPYRDSKLAGTEYRFSDLDPGNKPAQIAAVGIATYHRGGWFDYHARDSVMWQATLQGHSPSRLMMAPTAHGGFPAGDRQDDYRAGPYFDFFADSTTTRLSLNREKLRYFDHYLRGIDNGFDREPPVLLYVMGEGWRAEQEWPLARQESTQFYFASDGRLSREPGPAGTDEYIVDLKSDSRTKGANRWNFMLAFAKDIMQVDASNGRRLEYTGDVLEAAVEVTGHPIATVQLSADVSAGDLFVYLEDVAPDGSVYLVTEGQLRANFAGRLPLQEMVDGNDALQILPDLPWHGYDEEHFIVEPFIAGEPVELTLDLMPTSWIFKAGHRLRVAIAAADAPSFAVHPALASAPKPPVYSVYRGTVSGISLPVIPRDDH